MLVKVYCRYCHIHTGHSYEPRETVCHVCQWAISFGRLVDVDERANHLATRVTEGQPSRVACPLVNALPDGLGFE